MMVKYSKFLVLTACVVVSSLFVKSEVIRGVTSRRSLVEELPELVDSRPICSGPRRPKSANVELQEEPFIQKAVYSIHLGFSTEYGELNNKLIELVNAVDVALDSGGLTIVVVSSWMAEAMMPFFPDDESWERLEQDFPITRNSAAHQLPNLMESTEQIFFRKTKKLAERSTPDMAHARRLKLLHYMFSSLEGEPCNFLHKLEGYLGGKFNETNYVAIHVRNLNGNCEAFHAHRFAREQCSMSPSYVKGIMADNGIADRKLPIYLLSDMQDEEKLHKLQDELDHVVMPIWDYRLQPSIIADMVVGASSEVFIGQRGSTVSFVIGFLREVFGKDVSTNYIFMDQTEDGKWTSSHPNHP